MTTSISSISKWDYLVSKHNFVVSQLKHLTPKTRSLGISKCGLPFFTFKIDGDIRKFVQISVY